VLCCGLLLLASADAFHARTASSMLKDRADVARAAKILLGGQKITQRSPASSSAPPSQPAETPAAALSLFKEAIVNEVEVPGAVEMPTEKVEEGPASPAESSPATFRKDFTADDSARLKTYLMSITPRFVTSSQKKSSKGVPHVAAASACPPSSSGADPFAASEATADPLTINDEQPPLSVIDAHVPMTGGFDQSTKAAAAIFSVATSSARSDMADAAAAAAAAAAKTSLATPSEVGPALSRCARALGKACLAATNKITGSALSTRAVALCKACLALCQAPLPARATGRALGTAGVATTTAAAVGSASLITAKRSAVLAVASGAASLIVAQRPAVAAAYAASATATAATAAAAAACADPVASASCTTAMAFWLWCTELVVR
jgi:hypothetical protein